MTHKNILFSWFGFNDFANSMDYFGSGEGKPKGPVHQAATDTNLNFTHIFLLHGYSQENKSINFEELHLIDNRSEKSCYINDLLKEKQSGEYYKNWLKKTLSRDIFIYEKSVKLDQPNNLDKIYKEARQLVTGVMQDEGDNTTYTFHLSPGTPSMAFAWTCIAMSTEHRINLIVSSDKIIRQLKIPFKLKIEKIPKPTNIQEMTYKLFEGIDESAFSKIVSDSKEMKEVIEQACINAQFGEPILILGETGVGKTLLARAIHDASKRKGQFIPVNCSAIPVNLIESKLFGHTKGSFSGAYKDVEGAFKNAENGTIFLDEIGEISKDIQVKLLDGPLDGKVRPIGGKLENFNIHVITATNRDLNKEVSMGNFRSDLFYRLAVGVITIPPLRLRKNDLKSAIDKIIDELNTKFKDIVGKNWKNKDIEKSAKTFIIEEYELSGNYRELKNILYSAFKNSYSDQGNLVGMHYIKEAINAIAIPNSNTVHDTDEDLIKLIAVTCSSVYKFKSLSAIEKKDLINKALTYTKNNKDQAAALLKISRQALHSNIEKYIMA